jgi:NAD-dependent histone deacetylase SIR2
MSKRPLDDSSTLPQSQKVHRAGKSMESSTASSRSPSTDSSSGMSLGPIYKGPGPVASPTPTSDSTNNGSHINPSNTFNSSSTTTAIPSALPANSHNGTASHVNDGTFSPFVQKRPIIRKVDGKWILPPVTMEETSEARKYLKREGMMGFLDKYLPDPPKGSDLLYVIVQLGFFSFSFDGDIDDEKNLMKIVKLLQKAMKKVLCMRSRILGFNSIDAVVDAISKSNKILVLTGAGISTSLGIPDFRSSQGIYSKVKHLGLSDPQEVFDLDQFDENPDIFYTVAHMILPPIGSYTPLHSFIKKLETEGKLLRNYTQNIDNLEGNVGLSPAKYIQCHGSFAKATCRSCGHEVDGTKIYKYIKDTELPICPLCYKERQRRFNKNEDFYPQSYGVMKPNITFFGEKLPSDFHDSIKKDVMDCDLLLCIGTSLKVSPVSEIVNMIPEDVPQILINKDLVEHAEFDVSLLGYCDQVATYLCKKLNWKLEHENVQKINSEGLNLVSVDPEVGIFEVLSDKQVDEGNKIDLKHE